jgi:hypothetical protein
MTRERKLLDGLPKDLTVSDLVYFQYVTSGKPSYFIMQK